MQLHLGCGKRFIPGFIHIDICKYPHIDFQHSVDSLPMFHDNSVNLIYASHVIEYFDREQAVAVLTEYRRVLRSGGVLRLAVPDFPALVEVYRRTGDLSRILGPLYGRMIVDTGEIRTLTLYHRTVYDFVSLRELLERQGFVDVRRYDWRETIHRTYDDHSQAYFPHMDKNHGMLVSLNVECKKP